MNLLIYSETNKKIGGIERFIESQVEVFKCLNIKIFLYFENLTESNKIKIPNGLVLLKKEGVIATTFGNIIFHKFTDLDLVDLLLTKSRSIAVIHDHDYYCKRGHKYFPDESNCSLPYSEVRCSLCSCFGLKKKDRFPYLKFVNSNTKSKLDLIKKMDMFVVISEYMKNNLIINGVDRERVIIIKPFVPCQADIPKVIAKNDGLYVGQLIKGKGILRFIENMSNKPWKLKVIGSGKDLIKIKKEVMEKDNIEVCGFQNPDGFYKNSKFLIFTSTWNEPFGLVGIEAMSFGLPVVAFDVGGVKDWLVHGVNGFLVDQGDYDSFNYYCDKLCNDFELAKKMGMEARRFVKKDFGVNNYISSWKVSLGLK